MSRPAQHRATAQVLAPPVEARSAPVPTTVPDRLDSPPTPGPEHTPTAQVLAPPLDGQSQRPQPASPETQPAHSVPCPYIITGVRTTQAKCTDTKSRFSGGGRRGAYSQSSGLRPIDLALRRLAIPALLRAGCRIMCNLARAKPLIMLVLAVIACRLNRSNTTSGA